MSLLTSSGPSPTLCFSSQTHHPNSTTTTTTTTTTTIPNSIDPTNLYHWNSLIASYSKSNSFHESIQAFHLLLSTTNLTPDHFTLPSVLKSCASLSMLKLGQSLHGIATKLDLTQDTFVGNSLISLYSKCGRMGDAVRVFETMHERNVVSWNTMLSGLFANGLVAEGFELLETMMGIDGLSLDEAALVAVLPVCASEGWVETGRLVHGLSVKLGWDRELRVRNALVDMYCKCGWLVEARRLFEETVQRNVVSWNLMIGGCSRNGNVGGAFDLLRRMVIEEGVNANEITILNVLPACMDLLELFKVKEVHGYVIRNDFDSNELVLNALIAAYAKCGSLKLAEDVFDGMAMKTVNSWNALIGGCAQNGDPSWALELFYKMTSLGLEPDWFSIGSLLLACTHLKNLRIGKSIHGFAQRNGLDMDSFIKVSLISLYIQCGQPSKSRILFDELEERDVVSWNVMFAGYSQNGLPNETLKLFLQMQHDGFEPTTVSLTSSFMACAQLLSLRYGKEMHCFALKASFTEDSHVGSSIIDMYAKCGSIENSFRIFDKMENKDLVSWNVIIMNCAIHGHAFKAIELHHRMQTQGIKPDAFTYIGILMACSHAGLVNEGLQYFEEMKKRHNITLKLEHYACVADMLGRAGKLADAMKLIEDMPEEPDSKIWSSLLNACKIHGNVDYGQMIAKKLLELEPDKVEHYIMASNLFAGAGRWDDVKRVRRKLVENGLQKVPGCSWIELGGEVYNFTTGDIDE